MLKLGLVGKWGLRGRGLSGLGFEEGKGGRWEGGPRGMVVKGKGGRGEGELLDGEYRRAGFSQSRRIAILPRTCESLWPCHD